MPVDGRLPAVEDTLTIARTVAVREVRQRGADRPHVAHDVQLPVRVPLVVGHVLEPRLPRDADVVDEHVEPAESSRGLCDGALGLSGRREIAGHVERLADAGRRAPAARRDASALLGELSRDGSADAARRAGDEARPACESQIHGELAYRPWPRSSSPAMERRTGTATASGRATATRRSTSSAAAGCRARSAPRRRRRSTRSTRAISGGPTRPPRSSAAPRGSRSQPIPTCARWTSVRGAASRRKRSRRASREWPPTTGKRARRSMNGRSAP